MSYASHAIALTLGALSVCCLFAPQTSPSEGGQFQVEALMAGDCRPDIGPGGILKIYPAVAGEGSQSVSFMKIPDRDGKGKVIFGWPDGSTELDLLKKYTLVVRFKDGKADLMLDGKVVKTFSIPLATLPFGLEPNGDRVLLVDNEAGGVKDRHSKEVFKYASLLHVFIEAEGKTSVATVSFTEQ